MSQHRLLSCKTVLILSPILTLGLSSCARNLSSTSSPPPDLQPLTSAAKPLFTPTYDGSGQGIEPSVRVFPSPWHGFTHWMIFSPYSNGDALKENPSILASSDGLDWVVPPGLTNPLESPSRGHFADADLFHDVASDQLWVYLGWENSNSSSIVLRMTSADGVNWNSPQIVLEVPNYQWTSPTVQKLGNTYFMWTVNAGPVGCFAASTRLEYRISADGVLWSRPQAADILQPGYAVWHTEVSWVDTKQEFWMVYAAYATDCNHTLLFFARSPDGIHWTTYNEPALSTVPGGWDSSEIYRSGLAYDPATDLLRVWYSARAGSAWHIGYTQVNYTQFLTQLQQ